MTTDQLKRFKTEVETHFKENITEVKLCEALANYNRNGYNLSIFTMNNVVEVVSSMGVHFQQRFTDTTSKIEAMLRAMAFVMLNSSQGNSFSFSFGGM